MPRNFLISYSGRVGSTALIDTLKLIPGFLIPVFEELDYYAIEQAGELDKHNEGNIHIYVDHIYRKLSRPDLSVGFKWRMWGDMEKLAGVLREHNVLVFSLVRADLLEHVSSMYISNVIHKDFNAPQFMLRDAETEEERERILFRYRAQKYEVDLETFLSLTANQVRIETERLQLLKILHSFGVDIEVVNYETFAYSRLSFLSTFLKNTDVSGLNKIPITKLAKVSVACPSELFQNREVLLNDSRCFAIFYAWQELLERFSREILSTGDDGYLKR